MTSRFLVYGLVDPRTGDLRYVGKSSSGLARPRQHSSGRSRAYPTHTGRWLAELYSELGRGPAILVLRECEDNASALASEIACIALFRSCGFLLTNATDGGEGTTGCPLSDETKKKISVANRGRKRSAEFCVLNGIRSLGRVPTVEQKAKIKAAMAPIFASEEYRSKMRVACSGKKRSEETKARISRSHLGMHPSDETRAKISASKRGKKLPESVCKKLSEAQKQRYARARALRYGQEAENSLR